MRLTSQRRTAAQILKCGQGRIWFDNARIEEIKQAITKADIRHLINDFAIQKKPKVSISRYRFRKALVQKKKGRRAGPGKRKGKRAARLPQKTHWMSMIRLQRKFLKTLRDKEIVTPGTYHMLYKKAKGGFFRSKRHLKLYMEEQKLAHEKQTKTRSSKKKTARE